MAREAHAASGRRALVRGDEARGHVVGCGAPTARSAMARGGVARERVDESGFSLYTQPLGDVWSNGELTIAKPVCLGGCVRVGPEMRGCAAYSRIT